MTDRPLLSPLNRVLGLALAAATLASFFFVPLDAILPIHWGPDGQPDNFAPAPIALLIPFAMAAFVIALLAVLRPAGLRKDFEAGRHVIEATITFVMILALIILAATIALGLGHTVDMPRLVAVLVGAMLLVVGNYLPKTQPNWVAGIRLPWTLRDANNWRVTHRWTGLLMMLGGVVAVLAAILNPPAMVLFVLVLLSAILPALAGLAISYAIARKSA